jgi:hypothetical protein
VSKQSEFSQKTEIDETFDELSAQSHQARSREIRCLQAKAQVEGLIQCVICVVVL